MNLSEQLTNALRQHRESRIACDWDRCAELDLEVYAIFWQMDHEAERQIVDAQ